MSVLVFVAEAVAFRGLLTLLVVMVVVVAVVMLELVVGAVVI